MEKIIGYYAFIIGVVIAVVLGIFSGQLGPSTASILFSVLVILGLIVGFLNVGGKEVKEFLLTATILVIIAYAGGASGTLASVAGIGQYISGVFNAIMAFVVPAAIIAALKEVYELAQNK